MNGQPDERLLELEKQQRIAKVLNTLPYREREIIKMRFGLGCGYAYTLAATAKAFGITPECVRQVQVRAMRRLKQPSRTEALKDLL